MTETKDLALCPGLELGRESGKKATYKALGTRNSDQRILSFFQHVWIRM